MFGKAIVRGLLAAATLCYAVVAQGGDVFNMGSGLTSLEAVPVGDPGNITDNTGHGSVNYGYNIGKYEVTAGQYTEFLNAVAKTDTYEVYCIGMVYDCQILQNGASGSYTYSVASDCANRPVNYVSWGSAARFANWLHNGQPTGEQNLSTTEDGAYYLNGATTNPALLAVSRKADWKWAIPSEDEWYKAAYYKSGGTNSAYWYYPTRSNSAPGQDMADASGNNANYVTDPPFTYPLDSGKYTTIVGEFQNSWSPYGTFDQGGNVAEWTESTIPGYGGDLRQVRGGSFGDCRSELSASYYEDGGSPLGVSSTFGFRVVGVAEPGSIIMLAATALAALLCRRRRPT
jgi:formylglycine-generating enzyme